ncbi:hypothetical protein DIPPA_06967 [Diplonema papillatum]|nr:hypothetical protein DIPPA_06967 [Diplonema papillatum]
MLLFLMDGTCGGDEIALHWIQHPTGLVVADSIALGVVVGNFILVCAVALLLRILVKVLVMLPCVSSRRTVTDVRAMVRFPAAPLFLLMFWYQGTAYGAFYLLFHPDAAWQAIFGIVACCVLVAAPVLIALKIRSSVPRYGQFGKAYYREDSIQRSATYTYFFGPGEWVSKERNVLWGQRYQTVIKRYRQPFACFSLVDFWAMALVALATAISPESFVSCGHIRIALCLISFIVLCIELYLRPHARQTDNVMDIGRLTFQSLALLFMAIGFYTEVANHWAFGVALVCFTIAVGIVIVKVIIDVVLEICLFRSKRKVRIQEEAWNEESHLTMYSAEMSHKAGAYGEGVPATPLSRSREAAADYVSTAPSSPGHLDTTAPTDSWQSPRAAVDADGFGFGAEEGKPHSPVGDVPPPQQPSWRRRQSEGRPLRASLEPQPSAAAADAPANPRRHTLPEIPAVSSSLLLPAKPGSPPRNPRGGASMTPPDGQTFSSDDPTAPFTPATPFTPFDTEGNRSLHTPRSSRWVGSLPGSPAQQPAARLDSPSQKRPSKAFPSSIVTTPRAHPGSRRSSRSFRGGDEPPPIVPPMSFDQAIAAGDTVQAIQTVRTLLSTPATADQAYDTLQAHFPHVAPVVIRENPEYHTRLACKARAAVGGVAPPARRPSLPASWDASAEPADLVPDSHDPARTPRPVITARTVPTRVVVAWCLLQAIAAGDTVQAIQTVRTLVSTPATADHAYDTLQAHFPHVAPVVIRENPEYHTRLACKARAAVGGVAPVVIRENPEYHTRLACKARAAVGGVAPPARRPSLPASWDASAEPADLVPDSHDPARTPRPVITARTVPTCSVRQRAKVP